jgi:hypothetical protein
MLLTVFNFMPSPDNTVIKLNNVCYVFRSSKTLVYIYTHTYTQRHSNEGKFYMEISYE